MDEINKEVEIFECPICSGPGILEEENGWCFYVMCMDCGCHTAEVAYESREERIVSARKAATLWNRGKVLSSSPGE
ncbi:MAG: Lar family restriction alleviation protein [Candidatus Ornithospirochaeta sp.]|nr:Lar family restriction alleviation protein [Sphaerochaetaceae bacterium]MDD7161890.1 Lar family restriction alleviation protein [Sphaerochaetaceae bacterium]MDY5523273.1 Lar family restriction alleviation protein [Candidatus Ornithospirochaeta sp.]